MRLRRWLPDSLARRFALAAAGMAAVALLVTSLASWWLMNRQQTLAAEELTLRETGYRAAAVGSDLEGLVERMAEIASSTVMATALVDSAGRETYLLPFLRGVHQINGIPVQLMLTDFAGQEIATNESAEFTPEQRQWLREALVQGLAAARIFTRGDVAELVALEPMTYARTASPEGAIMYKLALRDVEVGQSMRLTWGPLPASQGKAAASTQYADVPVPPSLAPLQLRVRSDVQFDQAPARVPMPYLAVLALMSSLFALVVIAGMRLARLLTLDLQQLEGFSSRLLGSGLETIRAPVTGSTEVASLARSINDMLDRLNQQHATLLGEREKLTRLTHALQVADRNKDNFLAMLGHELRNPMAPISNGAQLLRMLPGTDPRIVATSDIIVRQVAQMTKIVGDLLDVSRVTRGLITLQRSEVDMGEIARSAVEQVQSMIDDSRHLLELVLPDEPVVVLGDPARLVQVVSNLLANAAKYTPPEGRIEVRVDSTELEATLTVSDNGVGISAELLPEVFDLFTQGSRNSDRSQGGLGLGLALVKHLVILHHGRVAVSSAGAGQGSSFTVTIPRGQSASVRPVSAIRPSAQDDSTDHGAVGIRPMRVLIVDDNVDAAQTLAQWLSLEGHAVQVAAEAEAALALVRNNPLPPEACILDIGLPGMDGHALALRLRAMPGLQGILLIALTGYGQASDRRQSTAAGFDHHLVKPTDPAQLRDLLAGHGAGAAPPDTSHAPHPDAVS